MNATTKEKPKAETTNPPAPPTPELAEVKFDFTAGDVGLGLLIGALALAPERNGVQLKAQADSIANETLGTALRAEAEKWESETPQGREWRRRVGQCDELAKRLAELRARHAERADKAAAIVEGRKATDKSVDAALRERKAQLEIELEVKAHETLLADAQQLVDEQSRRCRTAQASTVQSELSRLSSEARASLSRIAGDAAGFIVREAGGLPALLALFRVRDAYSASSLKAGPDAGESPLISNALTVQ
jgi:hypothetical protein